MAKKGNKPWKNLGPASSAPTTTKKTIRAPTKGYEDVFFTYETAKDAAQFTDTIDQLLRYMATSGWKQASALAKVMTDLKYPELVVPAGTKRTYLWGSVSDTIETTNQITLGVVNIPIFSDIDYQATMDEYLIKKRRYDAQLENWDENNAKGYYLVLKNF